MEIPFEGSGDAPTLFDDCKELRAAIARVRDIHLLRDDDLCRECLDDYPCATVRALDG